MFSDKIKPTEDTELNSLAKLDQVNLKPVLNENINVKTKMQNRNVAKEKRMHLHRTTK